MYLSLLNEKQKNLFLGFAYHLSNIDDDFSDSERQMLDSYCVEMNIKFSDETEKNTIEELKNTAKAIFDEKSAKIVLFELIGLAMADKNYDGSERNLISELAEQFSVSQYFLEKCESLLSEYFDFQTKLNEFVLGQAV